MATTPPPFQLYRDSRNNFLWKVAADHIHRRRITETSVKNIEIFHLSSLGFNSSEILANTTAEHDWIDSLAIV